MRKAKKYGRVLGMFFFISILALSMIPTRASRPEGPASIRGLNLVTNDQKTGHPKLQSELSRLVDIYAVQGDERAQDYAEVKKIQRRGDSVRVVTAFNPLPSRISGDRLLSIVENRIAVLGGKVETSYRNEVQHYIPMTSLLALADDPLVRYVRLPLKAVPLEVISEGVAKTGANLWSGLQPYHVSENPRICVLDIGFQGYQGLLGRELPPSVTAKSFRADGDITGGGEIHGAACAEIVYDMAPKAQMWLVNFETDIDQHNAVDYIVKQGIQVISYSVGWFNAGAGDGTGPIDADVDKAAADGILWASSAGNSALDHWNGTFNDPDGDGLLNFSGSDEFWQFHVPANQPLGVFLNWKDWGAWDGVNYKGSNQDYDLTLYVWNGTTWQFVDESTNVQNGTQWPTEEISGWYSTQPLFWAVTVNKVHATKNVVLELFAEGNDQTVKYNVMSSSLLIPADSPSAITAGASDWFDDVLHAYSSQGPTYDGRIKPDLTAPSGVSTVTYGPAVYHQAGFFGTSASAPHVAGACGLFRGDTPYSVSQVMTILRKRALDLGAVGPDNLYGYGRLNLK